MRIDTQPPTIALHLQLKLRTYISTVIVMIPRDKNNPRNLICYLVQ